MNDNSKEVIRIKSKVLAKKRKIKNYLRMINRNKDKILRWENIINICKVDVENLKDKHLEITGEELE
ncbi:MAG: hypothetical protein ACOCRK_01550 [bacterium]